MGLDGNIQALFCFRISDCVTGARPFLDDRAVVMGYVFSLAAIFMEHHAALVKELGPRTPYPSTTPGTDSTG
jgi:hypothetical protein